MARKKWTVADIPDQKGKIAVVTGANSGLGYETAYALAAKGAHVILAVRRVHKGEEALKNIKRDYPGAPAEIMELDLADLASIKKFADAFLRRFSSLSLLVNNAGVMYTPFRQTKDGFEMQFGTNHLGHFALTGRLLPAILAAPGARVVTVSSLVHNFARVHFDNLNASKGYSRIRAYHQSKLANLLFAYELERKFEEVGADAISVACHPGYADTNLQTAGPRMTGSSLSEIFFRLGNLVFAQSAEMGALPTLYAATAPDVQGFDFIGPSRLFGMRGHPKRARSHQRSYNEKTAQRLWQASEKLTGVHYNFHPAPRLATQEQDKHAPF